MKKILSFFCIAIVISLFSSPYQVHADGTYANIGTADAADAGSDGINFSQGRVWTIDKYGKYIWVTEERNDVHHFAFSNDLCSTWTQGSETTNFITRC